MTDNLWDKVSADEKRLSELFSERSNALGRLLAVIDMVMLAEENPTIFKLPETLVKLRDARFAFDRASAAVIDARLATL